MNNMIIRIIYLFIFSAGILNINAQLISSFNDGADNELIDLSKTNPDENVLKHLYGINASESTQEERVKFMSLLGNDMSKQQYKEVLQMYYEDWYRRSVIKDSLELDTSDLAQAQRMLNACSQIGNLIPEVYEDPVFKKAINEIYLAKKWVREHKGIDEKINDAFMPIAESWEGFILTSIEYDKSEMIDLRVEIDTLVYDKNVFKQYLSKDFTCDNSRFSYHDLAYDDQNIYHDFAEENDIIFVEASEIDRNGDVPRIAELIFTVKYKDNIEEITEKINRLEGVKKVEVNPGRLPIVIILLVLGALFFTIYFSFPGIKRFKLAINTVRGKYDDIDYHTAGVSELNVDGDIKGTIKDESEEGEVSHFQALATAVSGTVGLGNIAGVAVAIALGGAGATFWMIVCGLIGMSTKFVECTLGVKYRDVDQDGIVYGGPMYYLRKGLKSKGMKTLGKVLGGLFAVLCVGASFGGGNAFQSNQATQQISSMFESFGFDMSHGSIGFFIGIILALLVGVVIIGGIKRIAKITEKVVPFMAGIYVLAALIIILMNFSYIDDAFTLIYEGAFTPMAGLGGIIGVIIVGFQRAAFSNEAGAGSAAIAHSAVKTKYSASEGVVALLEPFIDTVVICTMTALVIIFFNIDGTDLQSQFNYGDVGSSGVLINDTSVGGVELTSMAFEKAIPGFKYVLTIAIILFAFSTMISWSYYGLQSWKYLFGRGKKADLVYKVLFLLFIVIGSAATLDAVIKFSDAMILALVFPNMIGLLILFPEVKQELGKYLQAIRNRK